MSTAAELKKANEMTNFKKYKAKVFEALANDTYGLTVSQLATVCKLSAKTIKQILAELEVEKNGDVYMLIKKQITAGNGVEIIESKPIEDSPISTSVEKKNTEDWYLDEDEGLWLDHDGIDGTLCDLAIGEIKPVEHKEYLITKCRTLYAARVWDQEDDHIAWQFFESEEEAKKASDECKKMYEANESGASL